MAQIIVHHEPHPEDNAALQAWYSRSNKSVTEHREKLAREGSGKFMDQIFIQYGHASVGDLGTTTVYFEGISMLAAKALQDTPLYQGQECSSRYIDFSNVEFMDACQDGSELEQVDAELIKVSLRNFYVTSLEPLKEHLRATYPIQSSDRPQSYERAIAARAFDILRGFLPCGSTTNVAWSGTLRTFRERLELLMHHPLKEVQSLAATAYVKLWENYKHSFDSSYVEACSYKGDLQEALLDLEGEDLYAYLIRVDQFYDLGACVGIPHAEFLSTYPSEPLVEVDSYLDMSKAVDMLNDRPKGRRLPRHSFFAEEFRVSTVAELDFGSFRDIQRHRNGYCAMPIVTTAIGFHQWYLDQLPEALRETALITLSSVHDMINSHIDEQSLDDYVQWQYLVPMGYLSNISLNYSLNQAVYVAELRSGQTVHPTLRVLARSMGDALESVGLKVYYDNRDDEWTTRRGNQDIVEINKAEKE